MPATMNCPGCQSPLRLRDDLAGKTIKCPRCGHVLQVPAEEEVEAIVETVPGPEEITAEPPTPKGRSESGATRRCPECGERVAATARKCRACKAVLDDDDEDDDRPVRRRSSFKPCPRCGEEGATRVLWTPWGSFYGPALFSHVRCPGCGYKYNGRSGRSNLIPAIIFVLVPLILILAILGGLGWIVFSRLNPGP